MPMPKQEQSAHTISQRLRQIRKIPAELFPVGFVVAVALGIGVYSMGRKFYVDKTLRLSRSSRNNDH